jgi:hypothetical protein
MNCLVGASTAVLRGEGTAWQIRWRGQHPSLVEAARLVCARSTRSARRYRVVGHGSLDCLTRPVIQAHPAQLPAAWAASSAPKVGGHLMELSSVWGWPIGSRAAIIESVGSLCIWRLAKPSRRDYDGKSGELSDRASGAPNVPLFQPVSRDRPCPAFGFSNLVAILMTSTKWNRRSYPIELSCYRNGFCPKASIKVKVPSRGTNCTEWFCKAMVCAVCCSSFVGPPGRAGSLMWQSPQQPRGRCRPYGKRGHPDEWLSRVVDYVNAPVR